MLWDPVMASSCLGYIDPASGSFIIQILIAGFVGAAFAFKRFWYRSFDLIRRPFQRGRGNEDEPSSR